METRERVWCVPDRNFEVELEILNDAPVLHLCGEIDVYTSPTLLKAIEEVASKDADLVLDCSKIDFLDSSGITVLIRGHKMLLAVSKKLILDNVSGHTQRVLEITGLCDILNVRRQGHGKAA